MRFILGFVLSVAVAYSVSSLAASFTFDEMIMIPLWEWSIEAKRSFAIMAIIIGLPGGLLAHEWSKCRI